ncbi:MAG: hypothetical protein IPG89_02350 [Bacteroidetes bacterium]|nr:hypothetical protein [Bacteroidota bacterium]
MKYVFLLLCSLFYFSICTTNIEGINNSDRFWTCSIVVLPSITLLSNRLLFQTLQSRVLGTDQILDLGTAHVLIFNNSNI